MIKIFLSTTLFLTNFLSVMRGVWSISISSQTLKMELHIKVIFELSLILPSANNILTPYYACIVIFNIKGKKTCIID